MLDRLRAEIVHGTRPPGEKLRLEHLAPSYGVGRTPLREACCRLAAEGLVTIEDQRGFRVAPISRRDLLDLTRTRQQIEPIALRTSIQQGNVAWEGEVTAALHRLERSGSLPPKGGDLDDAWEREHERLHAVLLSACDSPLLLRFCATLFVVAPSMSTLLADRALAVRFSGAGHMPWLETPEMFADALRSFSALARGTV